MSTYPGGIFSPRTIENRAGVVYDAAKSKVAYAEDQNLPNAEIVAIESTLGLNPQGSYDDLAARLDDMGGASAFIDLTDCPGSYSSQAGKLVAVNGDEDGLEFIDSVVLPTSKSFFPMPCFPLSSSVVQTGMAYSSSASPNTRQNNVLIFVPTEIVLNEITICSGGNPPPTPGTLNISLYSQDGNTRLFSITTASIAAANTLYTTAVGGVIIPAGYYYLGTSMNVSTSSFTLYGWTSYNTSGLLGSSGITSGFGGRAFYQGYQSITANTPATTIDPTSQTWQTTPVVPVMRWE